MFLFCLTLVLVSQHAYAAFHYDNCTPNKTGGPSVVVQNIVVGPDPIVLPGQVHLKIDGHTTRSISSSNIKLEIKRVSFVGEVPIPCIGNVGSCEYKDICTLLDRMEQENWLQISAGLGTDIKTMLTSNGVDASVCPLPPTTLNVADGILNMPEPPALLSAFTSGDYHFKVQVTEAASQEVLLFYVMALDWVPTDGPMRREGNPICQLYREICL